PEESAFDNHVATDPPDSFTRTVVGLLETEDFSQAATSKKLHLSFSESNKVFALTQLAELIDGYDYPWMEYEWVRYTDSDFTDTYPSAYADGLRFVFGG
ncbi:MAG: hypothetical protein ACR2N7_11235, partial [Acidimicrobiia bacterium]